LHQLTPTCIHHCRGCRVSPFPQLCLSLPGLRAVSASGGGACTEARVAGTYHGKHEPCSDPPDPKVGTQLVEELPASLPLPPSSSHIPRHRRSLLASLPRTAQIAWPPRSNLRQEGCPPGPLAPRCKLRRAPKAPCACVAGAGAVDDARAPARQHHRIQSSPMVESTTRCQGRSRNQSPQQATLLP